MTTILAYLLFMIQALVIMAAVFRGEVLRHQRRGDGCLNNLIYVIMMVQTLIVILLTSGQ